MPLNPFIYQAQPIRVVFGTGSLQQLPEEVARLNGQRALILSTPGQIKLARQVSELLGGKAAGIYDQAKMHVPLEIARDAQAHAEQLQADCLIAIGGGSTTGLAKAIALETSLPIIVIPTTYAGSEMTAVYGITTQQSKKTGKDPRVLAKTVIYDPALTVQLPLEVSMTSGINAIAHAAEGLYAQDGNPIMNLLAQEGIRALAQGMKQLQQDSADLDARSQCLYGAWLCGTVLSNVGMALHHKLCHTLGGSFNLPHAATHTILLPHTIAFNEVARPEITPIISHALGKPTLSAGQALFDFIQDINAPTRLQDLDFQAADLEKAATLALANPYWNPRPFTQQDLVTLLEQAYTGTRPL